MIYRCPSCNSEFRSDTAGVVLCPQCNSKVRVELPVSKGCAWDRAEKGNWVGAFFETVKLSLVKPVKFFGEVAEGSGWIRPWLFALIIFFIVFLVMAAYQAGFQTLAIGAGLATSLKKTMLPFAALSIPITILAIVSMSVVMAPFLVTTVLFINAAMYHLCLMVLGSARRDFWATFRTVCYTFGPQLFEIIPILGNIVGAVWQFVLAVIGIKVVHSTSYSRSALAIFLPLILCCGAVLLVVASVAGGVVAAFLKSAI